MDVPHLFKVPTHLPPHTLATFAVLCDCPGSAGPTEFWRGTHRKSALAEKKMHVMSSCPAGSLVLYDPRIMHRGGANVGQSPRPLAYLTFSRVWFRDTVNP